MRTTVDIPEDLHSQAVAIARDTHQTLSQAVAMLIRRGLGLDSRARVYTDAATGRVMLDVPRPITADDVRSLDDEE
jgi:hypothetical protein